MIEDIGVFLMVLWLLSPLIYKMWAWGNVFGFVYRGFRWRALLATSHLVRLFEREDTDLEELEEPEDVKEPLHIADKLGWH